MASPASSSTPVAFQVPLVRCCRVPLDPARDRAVGEPHHALLEVERQLLPRLAGDGPLEPLQLDASSAATPGRSREI
jgi:hypothetical protein